MLKGTDNVRNERGGASREMGLRERNLRDPSAVYILYWVARGQMGAVRQKRRDAGG